MYLHEAVKQARKELKLSQQKLAKMAGIQRRQLSTLEAGGNVTLATVRKVVGQLPNLEIFTLDTVEVRVSPRGDYDWFGETLFMLGVTLTSLGTAIRQQGGPTPAQISSLKEVSALLATTVARHEEGGRREEEAAEGEDG